MIRQRRKMRSIVYFLNLLSTDIRYTLSGISWNVALQPKNDIRHFFDNLGILTVALVTPAPSGISTDLLCKIKLINSSLNNKLFNSIYEMILSIESIPQCMEQKHS
jgi:hypothetical protein